MPFRPREETVFDSFTGGGWQEWQPSQIESYGGTNYQEPMWQEPEPDYYVPSWQPESQPSSRYVEPMGMGGMNGSELPSAQPTADIWSQLAPRVSPDPYIPETIQPELSWKPTVTGGQYQSATASPTSGYDEGSFPDIPTNTGFTPFGDQFSTELPLPARNVPSQGPLLGPFEWEARSATDEDTRGPMLGPFDEPSQVLPSQRLNPGYEFYSPRAGTNFMAPSAGIPEPRNDIGGIRTRGGGPLYQYTPETEAQDRFNELLTNQPQYRPSLARSIMASIAGFGGGMEAGQKFQNEPYARESARWKESVGPAQQAASLERQHNTEQRQAMSQQATAETNRMKAEETTRHNQAVEALADYKVKFPEYDLVKDGAKVMLVDPTGKRPSIDTGIDGKLVGQIDMLQMNIKSREGIAANAQAGANQRRTAADIAAGERNEASIAGRSGIQTARDQAAMNRLVEAARLKAAEGGGGLSPTMQRVQYRNNADQLLVQFPEYRGENVYIGEGDANNIRLEQKNLSSVEFEMIKQAIYGPSTPGAGGLVGPRPADIPLPAPPVNAPPSKPIGPGPNAPPGTPDNPSTSIKPGVAVTAPDGVTYRPPPNKVVAYNKQTGQYVFIVPDNSIVNGENAKYKIVR